jgi:hypothetical protein
MTDYNHVWGPALKEWNRVDVQGEYILTILTVCAWMGMIAFFVSLLFIFITKSDAATITMLMTLAVWLTSGISAIRIRRKRRRVIRVLK